VEKLNVILLGKIISFAIMESESTITLENFATLFETRDYVVRESEVIEENGVMIYDLANKWSCTFIFANIFFCEKCQTTHILAEMISVNGLFVSFFIQVNSLKIFGESGILTQKDEIVMYGCGNGFHYDTENKTLIIYNGANN
jgi:hypothetical protein